MPQSWSPSDDLLTFDQSDFVFTSLLEPCDVIDSAIGRYSTFMTLTGNARPASGLPTVRELQINVTENRECDTHPFDGMDEGCEWR